MLGKLIKYEFKYTAGKYGLMYLILAAYTLFVLGIGLIPVNNPLLEITINMLSGVFFMVLIAVYVCSIGYAVIRFYKTMVSNEGYLTHTLPAKTEQIVFSKFLVAYIFQLISFVMVAACGFLVLQQKVDLKIEDLFAQINEELNVYGSAMIGWIVLILIFLLCTMAYQLLMYYVSISVGQMLQGNKIVGCVLGYVIINTVVQTFVMLVSLVATFAVGLGIGSKELERVLESEAGLAALFIGETALMFVLAIVGFFVTNYFLKKKLNLN